MTSLLVLLLTVVPTSNPAQDIKEFYARQVLVQSGVPVGNQCLQCANSGQASVVTFTDSGWTCPNGHYGFRTSHRCTISSCASRDLQ